MRTPLVLLVLIGLAACAHRPIWDDAMLLSMGSDMVATPLEGGVLGVAEYREGRLRGAEAYDSGSPRWRWVEDDTRIVDHPKLPEWRKALKALDELASNADSSVEQALTLLATLPFPTAVSRKALELAGDRPERAARLLSGAMDLPLKRGTAERLVALAARAPGADDEHLALWTTIEAVHESPAALLSVTRAPGAGPRALRAVLKSIVDLPLKHRSVLWYEAGKRLCRDADQAWLLVELIGELAFAERSPAVLKLLETPGLSLEFPLQVLIAVEDLPYEDRAGIFQRAAFLLREDPRGARVMVLMLGALAQRERGDTAATILSWPDCHARIVSDLIDVLGDFTPADRARVLGLIIEGPCFTPFVQARVLQAALDELFGAGRKEVLERIRSDPRTLPGIRSSASRHLKTS